MQESVLSGVFSAKLPVSDLQRSVDWYRTVFSYTVAIEFPDHDGVVRGVAGLLPGVPDTFLALREEPAVATALVGFNLVNLAVPDDTAVAGWSRRLDRLDIDHSPVIDATIGRMLVLHDADDLELHLYSRQRHGLDQSNRPGYGRPTTKRGR